MRFNDILKLGSNEGYYKFGYMKHTCCLDLICKRMKTCVNIKFKYILLTGIR